MNTFDVIVLGNSIDGLTIAALLAQKGLSVMLIRTLKDHSIRMKPIFYSWDPIQGVMGYILDRLSIRDQFSFIKPSHIDTIIMDDFLFKRPNGWMPYHDTLLKMFPKEKESLNFYFDEMNNLGNEWMLLLTEKQPQIFLKLKTMMKYQHTDYYTFIEKIFKEMNLKKILCANLPRRQVSMAVMGGYIVKQLFDFHYIDGGTKTVSRILENKLKKLGGIISDYLPTKLTCLKNNQWSINFKDMDSISCKKIVCTYDEKIALSHYMPQVLQKENMGTTSEVVPLTISIHLQQNECTRAFNLLNHQFCSYILPSENIMSYYKIIDEGKIPSSLFIRCFFSKEASALFLQTDISSHSTIKLNHLIKRMMLTATQYFPDVLSLNSQYDIYSPNQIEQDYGYTYGLCSKWAFSTHEITKNPFSKQPFIKGLFCTGDWGNAWFTSALAQSNAIYADIK